MHVCKYCNRTNFDRQSRLDKHEIYCLNNPDKLIRIYQKHSEERKRNLSIKMKGRKGHLHTEEMKNYLSKKAKELNFGGYRKGSGRGKKGWYKGIFCDSSWELAFLIYNLDHNINIKRNDIFLYYDWNNEKRKYLPDFLVNDKFVEIKGYKTNQWYAKQLANPNVIVYYENDLKDIFKYVIENYGKNYIKLYENKESKPDKRAGTILKIVGTN